MSIYGSTLSFTDSGHDDDCAFYVEVEPNVFDFSGKPCTCGTPWAPIVYEGSHVLPSDDARRGGEFSLAAIPDHIEREGREAGPHPWLRVSMHTVASETTYKGKPYVEAGDATVILDHAQ